MKHCGTVPLQTDRLLLRRFTPSDAIDMYSHWSSDPDTTRYLSWAAHTDPAQTSRLLEAWERKYQHKDFYEWAVIEKSSGILIGSAGLVSVPDSRSCCEVGYCLGKPWWGRGYATEMLQQLLDFAVHRVGYKKVVAKHAVENPASGRVMEKSGMTMQHGETPLVETENGAYYCFLYEYRAHGKKLSIW